MRNGTIFDIQRGSFTDGDGIRTVVYLKGCNLRCFWCHNPESQDTAPQILFNRDLCVSCGKCAQVCTVHACDEISPDRTRCVGCGACAQVCQTAAKKLCGYTLSPDDVCSLVCADQPFYSMSGGGVTFSGGEPMLQIDFLEAAARKCKEHKINVAIDTAGNVPWTYFERVIPFADIFLYDIKAMEPRVHQNGTSVSNERILENLRRLDERKMKLRIRVPIIPGYNESQLPFIADYIASLCFTHETELLVYHSYGEKKYAFLDRDGPKIPKPRDMAYYKSFFLNKGISLI